MRIQSTYHDKYGSTDKNSLNLKVPFFQLNMLTCSRYSRREYSVTFTLTLQGAPKKVTH